MPTSTPQLGPLPSQEEPIINPKTGKMNPSWYGWMRLLEQIVRGLRTEIP